MLLIYSEKNSPRLQYVLQIFFKEVIQTEYEFTTDRNYFQSAALPKLNYSKRKIADEVFLFADDLLFENTITEKNISIGKYNEIKTLFVSTEGDLPFDPFAAAFYLTTRYEEYLPFTPDEYDRFPDQQSLNYREGFHEVPVVNHFAIFLRELLLNRYPALSFQKKSFQFQLTYDIDFAFAYRGKGLLRNLGGYAKSFLKFDWKKVIERSNVLTTRKKDLYDTFDEQIAWHQKFNLHPIYFFLLSDYGKFDKNIPYNSRSLKQLIRKISLESECGIHSGFASNSFPEKIKTEKERLEKITGKNIIRNRQHFLKLRFPFTYKNLLANGITEDYTMGYASLTGFRAGIATPFFWYDLSKEEITKLRLFPIMVMDASLYYYQKLSAEEAKQKTISLLNEVKKVDGYFQLLAHNDLLSESGNWKNWRVAFESILSIAS